jgi:hypothetical protein
VFTDSGSSRVNVEASVSGVLYYAFRALQLVLIAVVMFDVVDLGGSHELGYIDRFNDQLDESRSCECSCDDSFVFSFMLLFR